MWDSKKAACVQSRLALRLELAPLSADVELVAGVDCGYDLTGKRLGAVVTVLTYPALETIETVYRECPLRIPYIPGYLNFREGPALIKAWLDLKVRPDVTFVDGNGIAHPRSMGLASYLGAVLGISTIGCAKNPFYRCPLPDRRRGASTPVTDPQGRKVGLCLRTRAGVKPVYMSPGNRIDLAQAVELTLTCSRTRIPEPIRRAHQTAGGLFRD